MSLYGALLTGVSSLGANGRALGVASNNIANINTVGYKASQAAFSTLLASSAGEGGFSSAGVAVGSKQILTRQGLLQASSSATDIAIAGNGFFMVVEDPAVANAALLYTRAGAFAPDADSYLRNTAGYYLMGWKLDDAGALPANRSELTPINLNALNGRAQATSALTLRANLKASETAEAGYTTGDMTAGTITPDFERTIEVYDSQGGARPMKIAFVKTTANTWAYEITYEGPAADIGGAGNNPVATGTLTFNADGSLKTPLTGAATVTIPWDTATTGLASQDVEVNFGTAGQANGVTQFDSPSTLLSAAVDGSLFGALTAISIDEEGYITAFFDNGLRQKVFKVPLATFPNANGLGAISGNAYTRTDESGAAAILEARTGGAGSIAGSSLETSTVDLAKEFTDLITTQRAYSAATRIITTSDEMLEELLRVKR